MFKIKLYHFSLLFILIMGCTKIETIGMKTHNFSYTSEMIVWFQIPGLSEEHMALLRFKDRDADHFTALEEATCIGKIWNYSLTELRPDSYKGFLSQMSGSPNLDGTCQDFNRPFLWNVLSDKGFPTFVLENGVSEKESLAAMWGCAREVFKKDPGIPFKNPPVTLFVMDKASTKHEPNPNYFHAELEIPSAQNIYYDKSCQEKNCYTTQFQNVKSIYESIRKKGRKFIFIVRDFRYEKLMKEGQFERAVEVLSEIEKTYDIFLKSVQDDPTFSLVLSSSSSLLLDLPGQGTAWHDATNLAKTTNYKRSALMSTVFATGASAENFCGIYQEHEVFERISNKPPTKSYLFKLF